MPAGHRPSRWASRPRHTSWPGHARPTNIPPRARAHRAPTCLEGTGAGSRWRPPAHSSRPSLLDRRLLDGGADTRVGSTAADVAAHRLVDLGVARLRLAPQERGRGHDLAGLTIAALGHARVDPRRLQRLAGRVRADRLDGDDLLVRHRRDRCDAGAHGLPVDVHGAGTTQRHPAAELGPGEAQLVAERPQQRGLTRQVDVLTLAVDVEWDHRDSPLFSETSGPSSVFGRRASPKGLIVGAPAIQSQIGWHIKRIIDLVRRGGARLTLRAARYQNRGR